MGLFFFNRIKVFAQCIQLKCCNNKTHISTLLFLPFRLFFVTLSMAKAKKKTSNLAYLTKRRLASAARIGIRKAAAETMQVMGYTVIAENGWVVKKYPDGRTERMSQIETVNTNGSLALD